MKVKVKVSEASRAALNWMVAKCEGFPEPVWVITPMPQHYTCHCGLAVHPEHRNWSATHMPGCPHSYAYSTDWVQGGPILEREKIHLCPHPDGTAWMACKNRLTMTRHGPTMLIAGLRCYVASKLGEEVEVPEELL